MSTLKLQLVDVFRAHYPGLFRTIAELLAAGALPRDVLQHIEASGATPTLLN